MGRLRQPQRWHVGGSGQKRRSPPEAAIPLAFGHCGPGGVLAAYETEMRASGAVGPCSRPALGAALNRESRLIKVAKEQPRSRADGAEAAVIDGAAS